MAISFGAKTVNPTGGQNNPPQKSPSPENMNAKYSPPKTMFSYLAKINDSLETAVGRAKELKRLLGEWQ